MRHLHSAITVAAAAATAILLAATAADAATGLSIVSSPNPAGSDFNELDGAVATTPSNAWAVGFTRGSGALAFEPLAERWDGSAWRITATAPVTADDNRLHAVTMISASDGWAVGESSTFTSTGAVTSGLIEHWNGAAWATATSPSGEPAGTRLLAVSAFSTSDVWAVGATASQPVIEHWNGTAWSVIAGATSSAGTARLLGVKAVGPGNVWAVGSNGARHPIPFIEHWTGSTWTAVPQPVSGFDSILSSISGTGRDDLWAVGQQNLNQTVTEHWDGLAWTLVPSPTITANNAQDVLTGVVSLSSTDVWAVGHTLSNFSINTT
ncbi:MAG: hypothetical protein J2P15_24130, partial [Micromonosporaceae bacterium]|nr:hypothetical protein [Micromonosporaceae bacterium]